MTNELHDIPQTPHHGGEQEGSAISIISEYIVPERVPGQYDQEDYIMALRPVKVLEKLPLRRNPASWVHSKVSEQPKVDGFNWRKYGQKLVRGNTFARSYYKCVSANCPARKQVERSHDGIVTNINYLQKHQHPNPPHNQAAGSNEPSLTSGTSLDAEVSKIFPLSMVASSENFVESQSSEIENLVNNIPPDSKRQKKESDSVVDNVVTKKNYEARVVVETTSAIDFVNDGYRWRKYGQKFVKGNPNPRSYYRCSSIGCPVKKHVERASYDEKVVVTSYDGQHDHDMPVGTTIVIQKTQGNNNGATSSDGDESGPEQEANESTGMEMVVHVGAN